MKQPAFWPSAARIFDLSLGEMLWSRRSVFLALLAGGPVLLALGIRILSAPARLGAPQINGMRVSGSTLFGVLVWLVFVRFIVPVLGVFYGTSLIADEVDDKTITYLFTRPIRRASILVGKYLAYLVCTILLLLPSLLVIYFLLASIGGAIGEAFPSLLADLGMLAAGVAAYGALFALVGARLKRPLVTGLVFAFGWEPAVLLIPGYLKRLTIAYYLQALVPHAVPTDSTITAILQGLQEVPSISMGIAGLLIISLGALWAAGRAVERREYVLEQ